MCIRDSDRREVVDGDDFDVIALGFDDGAQNIAADAAEPVNGNANRHFAVSSRSPVEADPAADRTAQGIM